MALIALLIPLLFSVHQIFVRFGSREGDVMSGIYVSLLTSTLIFLPSLSIPVLNGEFITYMLAAGVLHFFIARICFYHSISRIGANLSAPLAATRVFFAAILGVILGEVLTLKIIAMSLLIFIGIVLISKPSGKADYIGITLGILTGFFTALSSFLVRFGNAVEYNPFFAIFIGFTISTILMTPIALRNFSVKGGKWYIAAGMTVAVAHLIRYIVLRDLPVTVVEPISSAYPLFTVILTSILLREREIFTFNSLLGTASIMTGIYLYYLQ